VVIGYGGDGTLNEVATGIAGTDTALGVLPGGSTNVFARTFGMPNDPVRAADLLARGIDAGDCDRSASAGSTAGSSASTPGSGTTPPWSRRSSAAHR
jgi:diacylglycerol kinase family enzyme